MNLVDAIDMLCDAANVAHEYIHEDDEHELLDAALDVINRLREIILTGETS